MPPLQQHIEDSLQFKIQKTVFNQVKKWAHPLKVRHLNANRALQEIGEDVHNLTNTILDILRVEVEKLDRYDADEGLEFADNFICKDGNYLKRQDVLDLLKTNQE